MSDKISYVLQVLDGYSKHTKKFKTEVRSLNTLFRRLDKQILKTSSSFSRLASLSRLNRTSVQTNNLARSIDRVNQANVRSVAISKRAGKRTFAGAYTPVKFDPYAGKYVGKFQKPPSAIGYGMAGAFGGMSTAKAMMAPMGVMGGAYIVGKSLKSIHSTTVEMDSFRASLSALIPKVKGLEGSTPEKEIQYLRGAVDKYGLKFNDIAPAYIKMLAAGGKVDAPLARGLVEKVGGYGGLLGLSSPALADTMRGFQDMLTKQVLNAQEVNLQMQQLPGVKPLLHEAFLRVSKRAGIKEVNKDNASMMFVKAMATGKLPSVIILKELVKVLEEQFGAKMLEKSFKLRNEEARLSNATQELSTKFGDLTYEMQIGTVRGLTGLINSIGKLGDDAGIVSDYINNLGTPKKEIEKLRKENPDPYGFTPVGRGILETSSQIVKLPLNTAYEATMGMMTGDWSNIGAPAQEFNKFGASIFDGSVNALAGLFDKSFGDPLNRLINLLIQRETNQQKVDVNITSNLPDMFSVKQEQNMSTWNRPQTVIAGTR
ncbi:MAG: hypothetical protein ACJAY9_000778 [Flavobacteriales bacterium]|jgi:hypothetical protein